MGLFNSKSNEEVRRETFETFYDLTKEIKIVEAKAKNPKFIEFLSSFHDEVKFSVNNNNKITSKTIKKIVSALNDIYDLLNHETWNGKRIKKKIRYITDLKREFL